MIWLIAAAVAVAVFALVWWTSGKARPLPRRRGEPLPEPTDEVGAVQKGRTTS
jgi:hypothetical protein